MRYQVDGEIKWCNSGDGTEREAPDDPPAPGGELLPVERKEFAVDASALFGGDIESEDSAVDFDTSGFDRLAGLESESACEFLFALHHRSRDLTEHALALEGGEAAGGPESLDCGGNSGFRMLSSSLIDAGYEAAVVGSVNFNEIAIFMPTAIHEETMSRNRRDRHFCHDFFRAPSQQTFIIIGLLRKPTRWMQLGIGRCAQIRISKFTETHREKQTFTMSRGKL